MRVLGCVRVGVGGLKARLETGWRGGGVGGERNHRCAWVGVVGGQAECASHLIEASERIILPVISVWAVGAAPCRGNVREKMR